MQVAAAAESSGDDAALDAPTVLIVDDDEANREGLAELLEEEGYDVATAANGRAALDQLRGGLRPCAILLDLMMPVMDGWDFRQQQLQDVDLKDVPVVVITAAGFSEVSIKTQLGDVDVVPKPSPIQALLAAIRRRCGDVGH